MPKQAVRICFGQHFARYLQSLLVLMGSLLAVKPRRAMH